jgi:ubiquinone/menaquinone biosynthesis C-methylase UbiE
MAPHYQDQAALQVATDLCVAAGMRVLQLFRCGDEAAHVTRLLELMNPPADACVVDVGCGVGEVARLMLEARPDLGFILLNLSAYQLELCPEAMTRVQADLHDMPIMDGCADVVMVNYTLGYADLDRFMAQAARVLKPGGVLFIYDLVRKLDFLEPDALMLDKFAYRVHSHRVIDLSAERAGFSFHYSLPLPATPEHLAPLLDDEYRAVMDRLTSTLTPTALRFVKECL